MIEAAVRILLRDEPDPRRLVRLLASQWPQASALQMLHVISMAAGAVEHMLAGPAATRAAQDAWRMAGLVGVDLYMMELMDLPRATAGDLMAYWQAHDDYFLSSDA